ncbi:MAG: shikimate kinase [Puniceicoccaceae bacterium]|nr:MAG: shikimate kinase [Puniceicoccaceae bacterium]
MKAAAPGGRSRPQPNLYLIGFMGTGKTTVGRLVAKRQKMTFLDSDHQIERAAGRTIPEIFEKEGETRFRELEVAFIEEGHPAAGCVVACGGGLAVQPGNLERLRRRGVVVCLEASPEVILQRTSGNTNRPLLRVADPMERIRELLAERAAFYRQAGTQVLTDKRRLPEIVRHVSRIYREEARLWRPPED